MRTIKFRAWDNIKKSFIGIVDLSQHRKYWEFDLGLNDNLILQQYTGLKDKNGKEIYEGDIVNYRLIEKYDHLSAVTWDSRGGWDYGLGKSENIEIVGNIHEYPELLNK